MNYLFLLDIPPEPARASVGVALLLIVIVVLFLAGVLIVGLVLLFKWLKRRGSTSGEVAIAAQPSSPNQP
jgi:hypothetical protein